MALKLTASASGKVILHGEHSVVYGKPAIAGVIGLRNFLMFEANIKTKIVLNFDNFGKPFEYDLEPYNAFLLVQHQQWSPNELPKSLDHEQFYGAIKKFVDEQSDSTPSQCKTLYATFYVLTGTLISNGCTELKHGFTLTMKSGLTMGAGLGSSASFGVCLAGVFHFYAMVRLNATYIDKYNNRSTPDEQNAIKSIISNWAFCSEKIMHGNPSGLDNTICTFGGVVKFYRGVKPIPVTLNVPLNILLVNTGVSRSTVGMVRKVSDRIETNPVAMECIFGAMGAVVEDAVKILENLTIDNSDTKELENVVSMNNNLLRCIGVSHPALEKIFSISDAHGFASKLTGAGGGGYATIYLPSNFEATENFKQLCAELDKNKFEWNVTTIGGVGFEIKEE